MRPPYNEGRIYDHFRKQKVCYKSVFFQKYNPLKSHDFRGLLWRRRWDSNPRYREVQLISSLFNHYDFCGFFVSLSGCFVRPKP